MRPFACDESSPTIMPTTCKRFGDNALGMSLRKFVRYNFISPPGRSDAVAAGWGATHVIAKRDPMKRRTLEQTQRAKSLRRTQTETEGLLWSTLRRKQLCGMKFRRQHPIEPYLADFACVSKRLVVELDGE